METYSKEKKRINLKQIYKEPEKEKFHQKCLFKKQKCYDFKRPIGVKQ